MIRLEHINKTYRTENTETRALDDVSIHVERNSVTAIIGTSGSGKTTLLNMIGCMDSPDNGKYVFVDENGTETEVSSMNSKGKESFRKKHISFVFQQFALMAQYTVYENVELPLRTRNVPHNKRKKIIEDALEQMGILNLAKKYPNQISGGQQQRCAIARAIVAGTDLILADEPTGALDSKTGKEIMSFLCGLKDQGKTVIFVTHDPTIASMADRLIRIEDGICTIEKN